MFMGRSAVDDEWCRTGAESSKWVKEVSIERGSPVSCARGTRATINRIDTLMAVLAWERRAAAACWVGG